MSSDTEETVQAMEKDSENKPTEDNPLEIEHKKEEAEEEKSFAELVSNFLFFLNCKLLGS